MKSMTVDELKQIVEAVGTLEGWDFSRVRAGRAPVLWNYVDVVRQYLKPTDRVLDIGTGGGEIFFSLAPYISTRFWKHLRPTAELRPMSIAGC